MKHLGDITKISGYDAPTVDVVIGGSPCQDLSVAGKRAGLAGERSGLFMEQIRIVKEMREADRLRGRTDEFIRPRYLIWENVPGVFSSNGGEDFRIVLKETARIVQPDSHIPGPPGGHSWPPCGAVVGDGWSLAWRVLDAQFWGVPQRRRRITLVADFRGQSAPEILFVRKGVCGDFEASGEERKGITSGAEKSTSLADALIGSVASVDCRNGTENKYTNGTLQAKSNGGMSCNLNNVVRVGNFVRRLTPLECERLQGLPDGWTDIGDWIDSEGKYNKISDSARYKALGNAIAIPPWKWILKRLCACYERDATLASLFDGIGCFPMIWEQLNGSGSCLWASEVDEFCMAVTKRRFGEE